MVNINLHSEKNQEELEEHGSSQRGAIVLLSILLILLFVYGGFYLYKGRLERKSAETVSAYQEKSEAFLKNEKTKDVFDFQNRLGIAGKLSSQKNRTPDILTELEEIIIPGIYISSYDYDGEKKVLTLELVGDQYNNVAKQVLNLKNSAFFTEVSLSTTTINEDGKIRIPVELKLRAE